MQVRVTIRKDGRVDITYRPTRPGEARTVRQVGVPQGDAREAIEAGVTIMRAQTKLGLKEAALG